MVTRSGLSAAAGLCVQGEKRGFTLIELLVVIAIIGLLSAIVLASLNTARSKARDAQRISNVKSVETAMELYYTSTGHYPLTGGSGVSLGSMSSVLVPTYIGAIPTDPLLGNFGYVADAAGSRYAIHVYLESTKSYCKTGVNVFGGLVGC